MREENKSTVESYVIEEQENISASQDWKQFVKSYERIRETSHKRSLPFDPKFNAVHWVFSVAPLCREIVYGYCWMKAYARYYQERVTRNSQPAYVDFQVSYFADNCITRINSCRDKLALMVWAYYFSFDPEKRKDVLDYTKIIKLKDIKNSAYLGPLEKLDGKDFECIQTYRHIKIHRMEPRIEMYGVASHHSWGYMVPLTTQEEIENFDKELSKQYPDEQLREWVKKLL